MIDVRWHCDRCNDESTTTNVGNQVPIPDGWGRFGLDDGRVLHLCGDCRGSLDEWLTKIAPQATWTGGGH